MQLSLLSKQGLNACVPHSLQIVSAIYIVLMIILHEVIPYDIKNLIGWVLGNSVGFEISNLTISYLALSFMDKSCDSRMHNINRQFLLDQSESDYIYMQSGHYPMCLCHLDIHILVVST